MENIRIKSERAILFADVCDSTSLMEALGDEQGRELIAEILAELERVSEPLRGVVVKTIGDEILLAFDSPMDAIAAAVGMQRSMQMRRTVTGTPLAIRVGLHYGSVLTEAKDVFGDVVNVAARVVAKATARQVLTTADTLDPVTDVVPYRSLGAHRLKGRAGHLHCTRSFGAETRRRSLHSPRSWRRRRPTNSICGWRMRRSHFLPTPPTR